MILVKPKIPKENFKLGHIVQELGDWVEVGVDVGVGCKRRYKRANLNIVERGAMITPTGKKGGFPPWEHGFIIEETYAILFMKRYRCYSLYALDAVNAHFGGYRLATGRIR
jgi:hypothetical protein